jgi:hypothetical protein
MDIGDVPGSADGPPCDDGWAVVASATCSLAWGAATCVTDSGAVLVWLPAAA